MTDEITRCGLREGEDEEIKRYEREIREEEEQESDQGGVKSEDAAEYMTMKNKELEERIRQARERKKTRPKIWRPSPGDEKAVKVEGIEEKEVAGAGIDKPMKTFILKDLENGQRYSLIACGVLDKHLETGKNYLLEYQGKQAAIIDGQERDVHSWDWEEIK